MIATNENLLRKIGKLMTTGFGAALLLWGMLVFSAQEASAQSLLQSTQAMVKLKQQIRVLNTSNCFVQAPSGTPANVAAKATEFRCEFYMDVFNSLPTTSNAIGTGSSNATLNAINTAYNNLKSKYVGSLATQAADLLKNEITDFLKS